MNKRNWCSGFSLDDFLCQEGIPDNARSLAIEKTMTFHLHNDPADKSAEKEHD